MPAIARRLPTFVTAVVGVVVAHAVDYLVVFPDRGERQDHLLATGHGYWPAAVFVAVVAGAMVAVSAAVRGSRRASLRSDLPEELRLRASAASVAGWQLGLFCALEVAERAVAGHSPSTLLHGPEFGLGLALQVTVAAIVVAVLQGVERLSARIVARRPQPVLRCARITLRPLPRRGVPAVGGHRIGRPRGPPQPASI